MLFGAGPGTLGTIIEFLSGYCLGTGIVSVFSMATCYIKATMKAKNTISRLAKEYDNYDEFINAINNQLDRSEAMYNSKSTYRVIDADFKELPKKEKIDYSVYKVPEPRIIDAHYTPVEEDHLLQNTIYLKEYVSEVAYEGYESDLDMLDAMLAYARVSINDELALSSIENTLHILTETIFQKACAKYDLPYERKRINEVN